LLSEAQADLEEDFRSKHMKDLGKIGQFGFERVVHHFKTGRNPAR
jgi:hypothetical protein